MYQHRQKNKLIFCLRINSIKKNNIKNVKNYFLQIENEWKKNMHITFTVLPVRKNKLVVLKSPHVNKKAKEKFQSFNFSVLVRICFKNEESCISSEYTKNFISNVLKCMPYDLGFKYSIDFR